MFIKFTHNLRRDDGNSMIEYGLIAVFISIIAIVALQQISPLIVAMYQQVLVAMGG